jgi:Fic family protein|tara:strand:+ start:36999 stop:38126 length:1128 start_codon:yes stop_codon:yes gene_type:complete
MKRWIWQKDNYPNFIYDEKKLLPIIEKVSAKQGELIAFTSLLNNENLKERQFEALSNEVINTSAIEGEKLKRDSVRASIGRKLGIENLETYKSDIYTDGIVEILIDANTNYNQSLELEKIFGWHNSIFPTGYSGISKINVAKFRDIDEMKVVSGAIGQEQTHYIAPPRKQLDKEISQYLEWFNSEKTSLIKAAIAHLWFLIIHPMDDGNGRIARAITDLVLSKIEQSEFSKLYSISTTIFKHRKDYYKTLDLTTGYYIKDNKGLDITLWIIWFLEALYESLCDAKKSLLHIIDKTNFWDKHRDSNLNARQIKVLNKILDKGAENFEGGLNKRKYEAIAKTTSATASRDIKDLIKKGCIKQTLGTKGRNVSYFIEI